MCDIDYFKKINDSYGHDIGDMVIEGFSQFISSHTRSADFSSRIGGEEFLILLPETPIDNAMVTAQKLKEGIESLQFDVEGHDNFNVTCSFGVTQVNEGDPSFDFVMKRADMALYEAKANGRNRVVKSLVGL